MGNLQTMIQLMGALIFIAAGIYWGVFYKYAVRQALESGERQKEFFKKYPWVVLFFSIPIGLIGIAWFISVILAFV
jgi:hypothetical protein